MKPDEYCLSQYFQKSVLSPIGYHESYERYQNLADMQKLENIANSNSMFPIKKFFKVKYGLNVYNKDRFDAFSKTDEYKKKVVSALINDIESTKNNLCEVYEKKDIISKFGLLFSQSEGINISNVNKADEKRIGRYEMIMKKRSQQKKNEEIMKKRMQKGESNTTYDKENKDSKEKESDNKNKRISVDTSLELNENKKNGDTIILISVSCSYCSKKIDEASLVRCNKCLVNTYCNEVCLNKDSKFHKKKCVSTQNN